VGDWSETKRHVVDPEGLMSYPAKDAVYTIREVRVRYVTEWNELLVGILLVELVNPIAAGGSATGEEPAWDIRSFRPLVSDAAEREADVGLFTHHLDKLPVDA